MNELQIFNSPQFGEVRTLTENGKTLFCGSDVARALGYARPQNAIERHCKGALKRGIGVQTGTKADGSPAIQRIEMNFIPEGDIYRLVVRSELPGAEEFESWIFDEVLPSLRQNGSYSVNDQAIPEASAGGVADLIRITRRVLLESGSTPQDVRQMTKELYQTYHVQVPTPLQEPVQMNLFSNDYQLMLTERNIESCR